MRSLGDGGGIEARLAQESVGQARVDAVVAHRLHADLGIVGAIAAVRRVALDDGLEIVPQEARVALVERLEGVHRGGRIVEGSRLELVWRDGFEKG